MMPRIAAGSFLIYSLVISAAKAETPAPRLFATPSFVESRFMQRHAGEDVPRPIFLPSILMAVPLITPRHPLPSEVIHQGGSSTGMMAGLESAGAVAFSGIAARQAIGDTILWGGLRADQVNPYRDGAGQRVNYGYERVSPQAALTHPLGPRTGLTVFGLLDNFEESRTPHSATDAPQFQHGLGTMRIDHVPMGSIFDRLEIAASVDSITYTADNFTLRAPGALGLRYEGDWTTWRGHVRGEFKAADWNGALILDASLLKYLTVLDTSRVTQGRSSYRLPDTEIATTAIALEGTRSVGDTDRLAVGLRLDVVHNSVGMAHEVPAASGASAASYNRSAQELYDTYYGAGTRNDPVDINLSGKLRYTHAIPEGDFYGEVRRLVRTPDPGERFFASSGPAALIQVGNPGLTSEAHHAIELSGERRAEGWNGYLSPAAVSGTWRVSGKLWHDRIADFITPDRARGQAGILKSDGGIIYRNVDAAMTGLSVEGRWNAAPALGLRLRLDWTRGDNVTDSRPLYQIAPLQGEAVAERRLALTPDHPITLGAAMRFAAGQERVDDSTVTGSGQDTGGPTGGYAVVDLFARTSVAERIHLSIGVTNLLDKRYQQHVNPLPQGVTTQPIAAPGRSLFLTGRLEF
ncbi:MAG: TonB-dependent receptor [Alphaproteobacteria bacterium]|nr:TonB-dependent receptor [Alphaproteobacteria bacterium]